VVDPRVRFVNPDSSIEKRETHERKSQCDLLLSRFLQSWRKKKPKRIKKPVINGVPPRVLIGFRLATTSRFICVLTDCYDADWSDNLPDVFVISEIPQQYVAVAERK